MIYSIICEELGLTGAILLILVFGLLLWRLCVISMHSTDLSGALLSAGIMGHLAIQVILNIAVVTNTIPNTGITLPSSVTEELPLYSFSVKWGLP